MNVLQWETELIVTVQTLRNPFGDGLFTVFTLMGEEIFYLLFLPTVLWCISRKAGLGLGLMLILSNFSNSLLKDAFDLPRPVDPRLAVLREETSPGFPSGHAQNAVAIWGYLAYHFRHPLLWILAFILPLGIGLSRVYLGVHFPHDILGGWFFGAIILLLLIMGLRVLQRLPIGPLAVLLASVSLPLVFAAFIPTDSSLRTMGLLLGLGVGAVLERSMVRFRAQGIVLGRQIAKLALGLGILAGLYLGMHYVFPPTTEFRFLRYAILGLWVTLGAPWLFVKLRMAAREV